MPCTKGSFPPCPRASVVGPIGACAYLAGFALPFAWDIPLMVLALSSVVATVFSSGNSPTARSPLVVDVLVFVGATGLSMLASVDMGRSVRLSAPLLPAMLLFLVIADHFHRPWHTCLLYLTVSLVGLGLASAVLWTAWRHGWGVMRGPEVGSPVLIVPNDGAFPAVIAPLSFA